ncbi:GNAT family N-acetyltransferase [Paraclostridium sordellii]|uniref:N-acetyltransferase GCN5 n=1 Tax=Paraclostridium sordellii TaxID=1505 RepID=A0A0C7QHW0_PARSO|nr:GNAT family N-acetyltransferase [Paeniclostridium sordellii]CEN22307.1 N-acetyltransferase GCN5 [[Clostridium] sordellii] [Paeniclostridium sordellii]CEN79025.1 N-acetyltransferase GCN5 [[Clostridium] sordellii] [Paeniclostridium sordellii]CEP39873.1 N-acetyltransferase GCN5 [[Clostridium] sordellii] [Paeniclostridium sordellii]CEP96180.1 N-acetyltransferase GCN5 [[Clostridium] sordellii] [Paeniclostridium sordellii]CEQ00350.1 N-acetyltransferase GCN5 [[Clostridium] sordellii] [Paeniclostri
MKNLETDRLLLRKFRESDSKDLFEYAKSELVGPNAGWKPHENEDESKNIIHMFIENNETYAIILKSENKLIGTIGVHEKYPDESKVNLKQRELGYAINPKYWGKGIMPEAINCIIEYGFNELNLDLIWCGHAEFNYNSKRVIQKCGFEYKLSKKTILSQLDNKEVISLFYCISKDSYYEIMKEKFKTLKKE